MWLLVSEHETDQSLRGKTYPLFLNKDKYEVGRDNACDITLPDPTVSRKHAILYPVQDCVKLEDEKSSVGTFINGDHTKCRRIPKDAHSFLRDGDTVHFGAKGNKWRLQQVDISVITTKLDPRDSVELKSLLRVLNGNQVLSEWSNSVTHLVTPKVSFTPKFLLALVNCVPIVNLQYFRDAEAAVRATNKLPDPSKYIPAITEEFPEVYDFNVNENRKTLFKGFTFYFLDEAKMNMFHKIIMNAGGTVSMWDKKKASIIRVSSRLIGDSKSDDQEVKEVSQYLLTKGRRLIPDSEIGQAIATVSMEKHCNPKFHPDMGHILVAETPYLQVCNSSDLMIVEDVPETIYVRDDEEETQNKTKLRPGVKIARPLGNTEIPETAASEAVSLPQFPDDDDEELIERSQMMLEQIDRIDSPGNTGRKRKHSVDLDSESPLMKRANSEVDISTSSQTADSQMSVSSSLSRFNSSQFITRPLRKEPSQMSVASVAVRAEPTAKPKRTLADLLSKDDGDSDEELFVKKKKPKETVVPTQKAPPPVLKPAMDKENSVVDAPMKPPPEVSRVRVSQVTEWLSKSLTLNKSPSIKAESLDETKAWIGPLINSVKVKEFHVDLSNLSCRTNRTNNSTNVSDLSANLSGKRNFKSFRKQSFHRCSDVDAETIRTKAVLLTEKL